MRAVFAGETILDSQRVKLLHETGKMPAHCVPFDDLRRDLLAPSPDPDAAPDQQTTRWSVCVGDRRAEGCVTAPPARPDGAEILPGYVTVAFAAMDRWFEEDDPIYAHPRDPYHRVDVRSSGRHVVVRHKGEVVAETTRPKLLFETANPVRYYLPAADVRLDLLSTSETVSECPYKGDGQHWHLMAGAGRIEDAAWSLPHPLPEGLAAAAHFCFYPDKVEIEVDGQRVTD